MSVKHYQLKLIFVTLGLLIFEKVNADIIAKAIPKIDDSISQSVDFYNGLIYDTNPLLANNTSPIWIARFIPRYRIQRNTNLSEQYLDMAITVQRSTDSSVSVDRNDPKVTLGFNKFFSNGGLSSSVGFIRRSTRITEFDDTGIVFDDGTRDTRFFNLNGFYQLSSKSTINAGYSISNNTFSNSSQLLDFTSSNINNSINHQFTNNFSGFVSLSLSEISRSTDNAYLLNPTVGFSWTPRQSLALDISIGKSRVYLENLPSRDGFTYSLNPSYTAEKDTLNASLIRSVRPNGLGFQESDKALFKWSRKVSDESDFYTQYSLNKNNTLFQVETSTTGVGFNKKLNNEWGLNLYFKNRRRTTSNVDADSNVLGFVIKYGFSDFQDDY